MNNFESTPKSQINRIRIKIKLLLKLDNSCQLTWTKQPVSYHYNKNSLKFIFFNPFVYSYEDLYE